MKFSNNSMPSISKILSISQKTKESFLKENLRTYLLKVKTRKWNKRMNECRLKVKLSFQMDLCLNERKTLRMNLNMIRIKKKSLNNMKKVKMKTLLKSQLSTLKLNKLSSSNNKREKMRRWKNK